MSTKDKVDILWFALWMFVISWGGLFLYWVVKEWIK